MFCCRGHDLFLPGVRHVPLLCIAKTDAYTCKTNTNTNKYICKYTYEKAVGFSLVSDMSLCCVQQLQIHTNTFKKQIQIQTQIQRHMCANTNRIMAVGTICFSLVSDVYLCYTQRQIHIHKKNIYINTNTNTWAVGTICFSLVSDVSLYYTQIQIHIHKNRNIY